MAVSKNNRKKGKKRVKGHMAPAGAVPKPGDKLTPEQMEQKQMLKKNNRGLIGMLIMLLGFAGGMFTDYGLICYPISVVGAMMGLLSIKRKTKRDTVIYVCYVVYIAAIATVWFEMLKPYIL